MESKSREPLAIVGMACRFPGGVVDVTSFWDFLLAGGNGVTVVPEDRWPAERYFSADLGAAGKLVTRWGGFTGGIAEFDADFFSISPREAMRMDPQQRRLLETTWEALEDAHCPPSRIRGSATGVYIGVSNSDYGNIEHSYIERIDGYTNSGNALSIAANRISYQYDLKGPSLVVDTACSSGLVAVNLACASLWSGECTAALAGATNSIILPDISLGLSKAGMLSPTGSCKAFDASADGYVRGEGVGMIFLKTLRRALADGDRIYATLLASVVNQDGKTSSLTVPGIPSQQAMLEESLAMAGIPPTRVTYVEAHGTGTPVGDPIEARALGGVLAQGRDPGRDCLIGSVKTNLGHLESASGLAGIIKAALVVKERMVPPNLHFSTPNPHIPFDELCLRVVTGTTELPEPEEGDPVVVVNSFGFGGTNSQVLLAPAPATNKEGESPSIARGGRHLLLALSARSRPSLVAMAGQYEALLRRPGIDAATLCTTAAMGRDRLEHRLVVIGNNAAELIDSLDRWRENSTASATIVSGSPVLGGSEGVVFVFTGQGSQWWGMSRDLLNRESIFREKIEEIDALLRPFGTISLIEELARPEGESRIDETEIAQPALFAVQVALVAVWDSWGVCPSAVVGHSVGEVAAACVAGILSLPDAVRLVHHRSRLQGTTRGFGRMVAVGLPVAEARERFASLGPDIELAVINSPNLVTLAGDCEILAEQAAILEAEGRFIRWIPVDYAFHTRSMDPIRSELLEKLRDLHPKKGRIPFYSTVTGDRLSGESLDAEYWWRNVREPVDFALAMDALANAGHRHFLEIGPHPALAGSIRDCLTLSQISGLVLHSLKRDSDDSLELARNLAGLYFSDALTDWETYHGSRADRSLRLPLYPWNKKTCWLESTQGRQRRTSPLPHPLLGMPIDGPGKAWEQILDPRSFPWLDDHRFWKRIVFPAAAYAEMGLAAGRLIHSDKPFTLEDLVLERILFLAPDSPPTVRIDYDDEENRFRVHSRNLESDTWTLHARGRLVVGAIAPSPPRDLRELRQSLGSPIAHWDFYEGLKASGYEFGPCFRQIEHLWHGDGLALAEVVVPPVVADHAEHHFFHASCLDACFQAVTAALMENTPVTEVAGLLLPASLDSLIFLPEKIPSRFWVHVRIVSRSEDAVVSDLTLHHPSGDLLASLRGFRLERVGGETSSRALDDCHYRFRWQSSDVDECPITPKAVKKHLLFSDRSGVGSELAKTLTARGDEVVEVEPTVLPDYGALLESCDADEISILHLLSLDHPSEENLTPQLLREALENGVHSLFGLSQALHLSNRRGSVLVALRSFSGGDESGIVRLASSPVLGFLRVAAGEITSLRWKAVLLDPDDNEDLATLLDEIDRDDDGESEVVRIDGLRHARRLHRVRPDELPRRVRPTSLPFRIESESPGRLDRVVINETLRREPLPDEVEVRVASAGINFRDLMKALAIYPGSAEELAQLGDDFAGTVVRVGANVTTLRPGERVVGTTQPCFHSHAMAKHQLVLPMPASLSFAEAATIPTAFMTSHYAIRHVGRMRAGESILIHVATGGVGFAAIQVARSIGLEIFATAGTEEKRTLLREMGIPHVMDSRSLTFAQEIFALTEGRGVDAVLNSLAGEFLKKSLSVLAPYGRFLEIGKVDLYADRRIGLGALRNNVSFCVIDLAQFVKIRREEAAIVLDEIREAFATGIYRPLPFTEYPCEEVGEVLRHMAQGNHIGKLVLDFSADEVAAGRNTEEGFLFPSDGTYLVAGGTSGYGFETARWLAKNGVRHLALLSRKGPTDDGVREGIEALEAAGVTVMDVRADLVDAAAVFAAVEAIERESPPIVGVVQAAMILDDRFIHEHDHVSFEAALLPKILGTWNLHLATQHRTLDLFLCHSSFSGIVGAARQSNYAAANTFLDEFARYRHSLGLAALSVNWGALAGTGYAERHGKTMAFLKVTGVDAFGTSEVFTILGRLVRSDSPLVTVARVDWAALVRLAPAVGKSKLFAPVATRQAGSVSSIIVRPLLLAAAPDEQRRMIEDFLATQVAIVFGAEESSIARNRPVIQLGLDSLMAIDLLNRIERELGIQFPVGNILGGPSIEALAGPVLEAFLISDNPGEESTEPDSV